MYAGTDGFGPHSTVAVRTRLSGATGAAIGTAVLGPGLGTAVGGIGESFLGGLFGGGHGDVSGESDPNVPKIRASSDLTALQIIANEGILPADKATAIFNIRAPVNFGDGKVGRAYEAQVAAQRLAQLTATAMAPVQSAYTVVDTTGHVTGMPGTMLSVPAGQPAPVGTAPMSPTQAAGFGGIGLLLLLGVGAGVLMARRH